MKIIQLTAENIKRIVAVEIRPDSNLVEITGKNGQGKTSILDAILWALGGSKVVQPNPIHDGADSGYVRLDLGDYIVTKKFKRKADGELLPTLTVENKDGAKYSSPQELLNKFLGDLTFDPLSFSRMKPSEQVKVLRALVPDYDFDAADRRAKTTFELRTDINRQIRDFKGRIDAIVVPEGAPAEKVSVEELVAELQAAMDHNNNANSLEQSRVGLLRDIARTEEAIVTRRAQICELEEAITRHEADVANMKTQLEDIVLPERLNTEDIRARIADADAVNARVGRLEEKKRLQSQMMTLQQEADTLTKDIAAIAEASANAVIAANLPVEGLALTEEAVLLNNQPFEQASDAEQLRASIAVAGAINPTLRVIRVRDGSLLDDDSWAALKAYADEHDLQVWVETVASGRESAVVIEDGAVKAQQLEAAE